MHSTARTEPPNDLGFVVNHDNDLACCLPRGVQMEANCGMTRDVNGDINFSGVPTVGFLFQNGDGDLEFKVI
jgi:hypothetical protein